MAYYELGRGESPARQFRIATNRTTTRRDAPTTIHFFENAQLSFG